MKITIFKNLITLEIFFILIFFFTMDALFCPQCRSILDIPADEDFIICSVCGERQAASGINLLNKL